jgi:hypothetical protein
MKGAHASLLKKKKKKKQEYSTHFLFPKKFAPLNIYDLNKPKSKIGMLLKKKYRKKGRKKKKYSQAKDSESSNKRKQEKPR